MGTNGPLCGGDAALSKSATYARAARERSSSRSRSSRVRASPRVSSFVSFGVVGSGPTGRVCRGHFRSRPRASPARVVLRAVQRRRIGSSRASFLVHFRSRPHVTPCVVFPVVQRRRIGPSRGEFPGACLVAPRVTVWRRSRRPVSSDRALMGRVSRRIQWAHTVRLRWRRSVLDRRLVVREGSTRHAVEHVSTNCRALVVREDRREGCRAGYRRTVVPLVVRERIDVSRARARSTICRALVVREDRRATRYRVRHR